MRPIWPRYFDDCHALVFVVDASADAGQGGGGPRLEEAWEVLGESLQASRRDETGSIGGAISLEERL